MPDPVTTPAAQPGTPPVSSTPPGSTGGNGTPSAPAEWRAPASAGKFAGMTAEQILGVSQTLLETVERGTPDAADTPPPPAPDNFGFADDEYVSGAQIKRVLAQLSQPSGDALTLAASGNERVVRTQHARDFERYGSEINALIARVPANLRTIDNLEQCVRMVRSNHIDDIARERAEQMASEIGATFRSTGAGTPPPPVSREHSLESDKISPAWKARAAKNGVTERTVEEFCRANDMTPADFYKQFDTPANRIVEEISSRGAHNG